MTDETYAAERLAAERACLSVDNLTGVHARVRYLIADIGRGDLWRQHDDYEAGLTPEQRVDYWRQYLDMVERYI